MVNATVSLLFPIYGNFDHSRLNISILAAQAQEEINLEIIVSEIGIEPSFNQIGGVKHIFTPTDSDSPAAFNPGKIRNIALHQASGEYVYTNDSDIVFLNPHYLSSLLRISKNLGDIPLYRPPMTRLPLSDFDQFFQVVRDSGIEDAIGKLDRNNPYFATLNPHILDVVTIQKKCNEYEKTFVALREDYERYKEDPGLKGKEPLIFNENRHCGGNFGKRMDFLEVGGYCEDYLNWGKEDGDLQWKMTKTKGMQLIPFQKDLYVLHMDHPKGYFLQDKWKRNEEVFNKRKEAGVAVAIENDRGKEYGN